MACHASYLRCLPAEPETMIIQQDRRSFSIYYSEAKEEGHGGKVVTIEAYDWNDPNADYEEFPSWQTAGANSKVIFVAIFPTDLQYNESSSKQKEEYSVLQNWVRRMNYNSEDPGNPFQGIG